jgi:hypothetical protein
MGAYPGRLREDALTAKRTPLKEPSLSLYRGEEQGVEGRKDRLGLVRVLRDRIHPRAAGKDEYRIGLLDILFKAELLFYELGVAGLVDKGGPDYIEPLALEY